ncbi:MAG: restriction endonuclease subunit S, partial [Candidatus Omnitrophota bacterium]
MSKQTEKKLVPKLRFPEFQDAGEWANEPLSDVYAFKSTNSFTRDNLNYEYGLVKNIHYGDIHTKFSTLFNIQKEIVPYVNPSVPIEKIKPESYCVEGDIIIADASEDLDDIGKSIEIVYLNNEQLLSGLHTILARQKRKKLIVGFGGYLFKSFRIRTQIKKEAQGAKVLGISGTRLANIEVAYPLDKTEQQKITDSLLSIDELINVHRQKLDSLKAYKKGLLQQLFPAEGETEPELRFPEFKESGKWVQKELWEVGEIVTGKTPSTSDESLWNGDIQFVTPTDIRGDKYQWKTQRSVVKNSKIKVIPKNSTMFTCIASIGKMSLSVFPCITNQQINTLIPNSDYDNEFVYYSLLSITPLIKSALANTTFPIINKTEFSKFVIPVPPDEQEQKKISDCLSLIDTLIITQSQKLEFLTDHKRSLMQQLF